MTAISRRSLLGGAAGAAALTAFSSSVARAASDLLVPTVLDRALVRVIDDHDPALS